MITSQGVLRGLLSSRRKSPPPSRSGQNNHVMIQEERQVTNNLKFLDMECKPQTTALHCTAIS